MTTVPRGPRRFRSVTAVAEVRSEILLSVRDLQTFRLRARARVSIAGACLPRGTTAEQVMRTSDASRNGRANFFSSARAFLESAVDEAVKDTVVE